MKGREVITSYRYLYQPARDVYHRLFNRSYWNERRDLRALFAKYIRRGDIAFDIGANQGEYARAFQVLGARVVAVEPNPKLASRLRRHNPRLTVVESAVGATNSRALLQLAVDPEHSTLSQEWAGLVRERFIGAVEVNVTTLDALIDQFGAPALIKIDVEGFEAEVLAGLSQPVPLVFFEFQRALMATTIAACERLLQVGSWLFEVVGSNVVTADTDELLTLVKGSPGQSGDILARWRGGISQAK